MDHRERLMGVLMRAHFVAATENNNVSSAVVKQVAAVGKTFPEAIAAALLTLGGVHAPVTQARHILFEAEDEDIRVLLQQGNKIPGYGNSFFKGAIDPAWNEMDATLLQCYPAIYERLYRISDIITQEKNVRIFPNAAAYTAIAAQLMEVAWHTEMALVIMGRMPAWTNQFEEAAYRG